MNPVIYAGLDYRYRLLALNKFTSSRADLTGILDCCCIVFEVDKDDIISRSRKHEYSIARHAFAKLSRDRTEEPLRIIGQHMGGRDHSTALNSYNQAENLIKTYPAFKERYQMCKELLDTADIVKKANKVKKVADKLSLIRNQNIILTDLK